MRKEIKFLVLDATKKRRKSIFIGKQNRREWNTYKWTTQHDKLILNKKKTVTVLIDNSSKYNKKKKQK